MTARLKEKYRKVSSEIAAQAGIRGVLAVPKIEKIVLNMGLGRMSEDPKAVAAALEDLALIAGQKPVQTKAKKAIAGFKVRQGENTGAKVTLRGSKMYEFLDRLISTALPRTRDFRGLNPKAFAGGSYSIGIAEHTVFPEIAAKGRNPIPLQVTIVMNTTKSEQAEALLRALGLPMKEKNG